MSDALAFEDERAIRALVRRYLAAVADHDPHALASTWAADGQWHLGPRTVVGREEIVTQWQQIIARYESRIVQLMVDSDIGITDDGAVGTFTFLEIARRAGRVEDHLEVGRYSDRFVREDGRWVFAERRFTLVYRGEIAAGEFRLAEVTRQTER